MAKKGIAVATSQALAVKYRPKKLSELVGQESVATQVRGMVKLRRFPTTIGLFGESGSGKTTTARMLAMNINCLTPDKENGEACGECASCKYGKEHPDLHELNMADNRGIDDIRALIQSARSMPTLGNKRIFILDEVHSCFPGNTKILMADHSFRTMLQIGADIKAGKTVKVMSYNRETKAMEPKVVTDFLPQTSKRTNMVEVHLEDGGYQSCTKDHKWWSKTEDDYVEAGDLEAGTVLQQQDGLGMPAIVSNIIPLVELARPKKTVIEQVELDDDPEEDPTLVEGQDPEPRVKRIESRAVLVDDEDFETNPTLDVFDITVEDNHNYYVLPVGGIVPVLVSNCTPQAFQTLLKPLEDAPEHTVWILCTTDPQKIPATVIGRCLKFYIKPIAEAEITKRLRIIGKREGTDFKEMEGGKEVLSTIANLSNGRMRDSINLLESVLFALASGETFTAKQLIQEFARNPDADLDKMAAKFLHALLKSDAKLTIKSALDSGNIRGLISKTRWLAQSLVQQAVGKDFYKTYTYRTFLEYAKKDKVDVKLSMLLEIQDLLCTVEMQLNSVSIDESVLFTSRVGRFLVDHKKAA